MNEELVVSLLTEIRDGLAGLKCEIDAVKVLNEQRENARVRKAKSRAKKTKCHVTEECHTTDQCHVTDECHVTQETKEEEKAGERDIPPKPPIEKETEREEERKEAAAPDNARARGDDEIVVSEPVLDIHNPPTLPVLLDFARRNHYTDEAFVREWFKMMTNELFWCHPKSGDPINHWVAYFRNCWRTHLAEQAKAKAEAEAKAAKESAARMGKVKHSAHWRGTKKENIEHVF